MIKGEPIGRTATAASFVRVPIVLDKDITIRLGEPVYIDREEGAWGYIGRITAAVEHNPEAEVEELHKLTTQNPPAFDPALTTSTEILRQAKVEVIEEVRFLHGQPQFESPRTVPLTGVRVYRLGLDLVGKTFGFENSYPLHIGQEEMSGHDVKLPVEALARHITILGRPGTGKSYTTGVFMEECVRHKIPVLIIDITGESKRATEELGGIILRPKHGEFTVRLPHLSSRGLLELTPGLETEERNLVVDAFERLLQSRGDDWTLFDLTEEIVRIGELIRMEVVADRTKRRLNHSVQTKSFIGSGVKWKELFAHHPVINIFAGEMPRLHAMLAIGTLCQGFMFLRERNECPPFVFILDEAHRFVPVESRDTSGESVSNFLRVGRHMSIGTILVSQSPSNIHRETMLLSNVRIIHALDGSDVIAISGLLGDAPKELIYRIPTLPVGTAVLCGTQELIRHTCTIRVRARRTTHGAPTPNLIEESDKWRRQMQDKPSGDDLAI